MYLPIKLKNGEHVDVEVESTPSAVVEQGLELEGAPMGRGGKTAAALAEKQFGDAVRVAQGIAQEVSEGLVKKEDTSRRLTEVALELSLGFNAGGNVFIAQGSANAALKLTLKWTLPSPAKG